MKANIKRSGPYYLLNETDLLLIRSAKNDPDLLGEPVDVIVDAVGNREHNYGRITDSLRRLRALGLV